MTGEEGEAAEGTDGRGLSESWVLGFHSALFVPSLVCVPLVPVRSRVSCSSSTELWEAGLEAPSLSLVGSYSGIPLGLSSLSAELLR